MGQVVTQAPDLGVDGVEPIDGTGHQLLDAVEAASRRFGQHDEFRMHLTELTRQHLDRAFQITDAAFQIFDLVLDVHQRPSRAIKNINRTSSRHTTPALRLPFDRAISERKLLGSSSERSGELPFVRTQESFPRCALTSPHCIPK